MPLLPYSLELNESAADGPLVVPVKHNKTFIAIAETYDFIVTIPANGQIEVRASVQDGSGTTSAYLGTGDTLSAPDVPRPDKIAMMIQMAKMDMRMGAPAMKFNPSNEDPYQLKSNWGMLKDANKMKSDTSEMKHVHEKMGVEGMESMAEMTMFSEYNYNYLKATEKTNLSKEKPVKEVLLNLTGNMWRYIWSMNGVPLSEADNITIEKGQVVRITLNNLTMMHHPMHLHGHFFRLINKNGEYSPLKHTVNVPPMQKVVIEFDANESGAWFFHCHVLYHLMGGMARVYNYGTPRDPRMDDHPVEKLIHETNKYYNWGLLDVASHMTALNLVSSNTRNQFNLNAQYGWNKIGEGEITYERYLYDYFRIIGGINVENEKKNSFDVTTSALVGFRFFTPYMFNLDVRIDNLLRPQISLGRTFMIFPRTIAFGDIEYQADFGWVNEISQGEHLVGRDLYNQNMIWSGGLAFLIARNFSVIASYDNRFGFGGGLRTRF